MDQWPSIRIEQIRAAVRLVFETFRQCGSASAVVRRFQPRRLAVSRRIRRGIGKGDLHWVALDHSRVVEILHNPVMPAPSSTGAPGKSNA